MTAIAVRQWLFSSMTDNSYMTSIGIQLSANAVGGESSRLVSSVVETILSERRMIWILQNCVVVRHMCIKILQFAVGTVSVNLRYDSYYLVVDLSKEITMECESSSLLILLMILSARLYIYIWPRQIVLSVKCFGICLYQDSKPSLV